MCVLKRTIFSCLTVALLYSLLCYGQDDNLSAQLPNSLLECYQNTSLYYRGNRLPHSMDVFIDLVRKIESVPNLNMDMRELVVALLHRFRLDGVVYDSSVQYKDGVLPFSVKGPQMYKNQLILKYLVQGNAYHFPNDSLSSVEKCSLHFMMSSSIDATQRGDESQSCQTYRNNQYRKRYRRSATEAGKNKFVSTMISIIEEAPDTNNTEETLIFEPDTDQWWNSSEEQDVTSNLSSKIEENSTTTDAGVTTTTTEANEQPVVAARAFKPMAEVKIVPDSETVKPVSPGDPVSGKLTVSDDGSSDCPIENGVVSTRWGSVNLGNLLAGIAAGLNPLNVRTTDLNSKAKKPVYDGQMDNKFAATFAGDLAEVALNQGSVKNTLDVGSPGAWNSTWIPQWYFIDSRSSTDLTDAELRGDLDGLILASKVQYWYTNVSNKKLTLSALLDMYYNRIKGIYDSPQYIACRRKELFTEVAPTEILKTQTRLFSLILNRRLPSPGTITDQKIFEFADKAVDSLIGYIPSSLDTNMKCDSQSLNTRISSDASTITRTPNAEIILIIDTNYDISTANTIIVSLATLLRFSNQENNITVVSGSDAVTLLKGNNFLEIIMNITNPNWNELYNNREKGLNLARVLQNITQTNLTKKLDTLRRLRRISDSRTVVLVFPSTGYSINDAEYNQVYNIIQTWKDRIPIARLLFACKCTVQTFEHVVFDPQRDILSIPEISNNVFDISLIENRIKELTQPIINPECGSTFPKKGSNENIESFIDYLDEDYGKIYSIHPKYFYGIETTIKVKALGFNYGQIRVCSWVGPSEIVSSVGFNSTNNSSQNCQTIDSGINKEWAIPNPCSTSTSVDQCNRSIYVSVSVVKTSNRCFDDACGGETWKVKYGLVATGLHCSGASGIAASIFLILITLLAFLHL